MSTDLSLTTWIFGYGSLIWKPNFPYVEKRYATLFGWCRRFYQGSPDHRGTEENPGRVVTLLPDAGTRCFGVAYRIAEKDRHDIFTYLDVREQGGYQLLTEEVHFLDGGSALAYVYIATVQNPYYIGADTPQAMANHIYNSHGPSGANLQYFLQLRKALQSFAPVDSHIEEIFHALPKGSP
ncbi:MAG: gamma-glutamylcyclotransferase [Myxococcota bacterium]|nr:gamma-glutamylcyclotransferase [Myxococcota bacterium]